MSKSENTASKSIKAATTTRRNRRFQANRTKHTVTPKTKNSKVKVFTTEEIEAYNRGA